MKKIFAVILVSALLVASPAYAKTLKVSVNGLVCDFCAQGVTKLFTAREEVSKVDVNLTTKLVTIDLKEEKDIPDEVVTKMITDSGFNVTKIERTK